jgi:hypothetical protein
MIKSKKYKIPIYRGDFLIIKSDNYKEAFEKFKIPIPDGEFDLDLFEAFAFSSPYKNKYTRYIILLKDKVSSGTIAHECNHIVTYMFNDRQCNNLNNDEPACYLLGWLVNRVHEFLDKT